MQLHIKTPMLNCPLLYGLEPCLPAGYCAVVCVGAVLLWMLLVMVVVLL